MQYMTEEFNRDRNKNNNNKKNLALQNRAWTERSKLGR